MTLNFQCFKGNSLNKELNVETPNLEDFSGYRQSLKELKTSVNQYLTTLVTAEAGKKNHNCN